MYILYGMHFCSMNVWTRMYNCVHILPIVKKYVISDTAEEFTKAKSPQSPLHIVKFSLIKTQFPADI